MIQKYRPDYYAELHTIPIAPNISMLPSTNEVLNQSAFIVPKTPIAPDIDIFPNMK